MYSEEHKQRRRKQINRQTNIIVLGTYLSSILIIAAYIWYVFL